MLLGANKSLLALTVIAGTLLTGCNEASPDPKSTNPTKPVVNPDAPTAPIINDDLDQFGWTWSQNFTAKQFYEIKVQGQAWSPVNGNPHQLAIDAIYAAGEVQVRVKADLAQNRTVSDALISTSAYTAASVIERPKAPTNPVQNDNLNTFDWDLVTGFSRDDEYEYSLTGGVAWTTVVSKPLLVGDVNIDVGHVQVRVKANEVTGVLAGTALISTQAFTAGVPMVIAAPTTPYIVNANIDSTGYPSEIKTNGFSWALVADFDQPEYYEFTNDGGVTWQAVTSMPQHIGEKAYDKTKVGVRVKKNAITNQVNPAGQVLFATAAKANFYVTRVVSMKTWDQAQGLTSAGNWIKAEDDGCYIEYDVNGDNPQFWVYAGYQGSENGVLDKLTPEFCGMPNWHLLDSDKMIAKTLVNSDYVPSAFDDYLVNDSSSESYWALNSVNHEQPLKKISAGQDKTSSPYIYPSIIGHWALPDTAEIVAESELVNTDIQASTLLHDGKWKITSTNIIKVINDIETLSGNPLSPLLSDVEALESDTKTTFDALALEVAKYKERLGLLALYSTMLESDQSVDDSIKAEIKANTALANTEFMTLTALYTSFDSALKVTPALTALILLTDQDIAATSAKNELIAATDGADIHAKSLNLFDAASIINDFIQANIRLTADLKTATDELPKEDNAELLLALDKLLMMFNDLPASSDVDDLNVIAETGLKRASDAGYKVVAADAIIGLHYAKLDMNGDYLPTATTYAQGWRCVMDNRDLVRKRIWTLLKDGLPNGADDLAFDASSSGINSVIGASGLVESTNAAQLCSRSDWRLPSKDQLISLETGVVKSSATIDVDVFPHHLAFNPEYDIDDWISGAPPATLFWYWTDEARDSNEQRTYHYKTVNNYATGGSALKQGNEEKVVLGRLVSEIVLSYQLLDSAGVVTTDIDVAACAYQPESKQTWQLFDTADLDSRAKGYADSSSNTDTVLAQVAQLNNANMCNKSNWRVPSLTELKLLLPVDNDVFRNNDVKLYGAALCYVSADPASSSRQQCYNMSTDSTSNVDQVPYSTSSYVYRLTASD